MVLTPRLSNRIEAVDSAVNRHTAIVCDPNGSPAELGEAASAVKRAAAEASSVAIAEGRIGLGLAYRALATTFV